MTAPTLEPRTIPLAGLQLIEASAGTGKTFNLAGLYLRLVVERGAHVRDILVMTFTQAATQELRERIRRRLVDAARIAADPTLAIKDNPEHDFAADVIDAAAGQEDRARIARRLAEAAAGIDEATIVTIHGFAQRAAADNAFDSGQAFDRGEIVDDRLVHAEAVRDLWRRSLMGATGNPALLDVWPTPEALDAEVAPILARPRIAIDGADEAGFADALAATRKTWTKERAALEQALHAALEAGAFKNSQMKTLVFESYDTPAALLDDLEARLSAAAADNTVPILPAALDKLAEPNKFIDQRAKAKKAIGETIAALDVGAALTDLIARARVIRSARAAAEVAALAERRKLAWRQFSYDDLVLALHAALHDPERGARLAAALRAQWPYALVDEFQDTDPLQYASLARIYRSETPTTDAQDTALLLIGDPKQAIYGFRGGDIHAYLAAAAAAGSARYTLARNFRSSPAVLEAIAALFETPTELPFLEDGIDFPPVAAGRSPRDRRLVWPTAANDEAHTHPALTVWQFTGGAGTKSDDKPAIVHRTVAAVAGLLSGAARWESDDDRWNRPVAPRDIAILVNNRFEAADLQMALAEHGIAAVSQRRDSIFASTEAADLALWLAGAAAPDNQRAVKSAETTWLAGRPMGHIVALTENEARLSDCIARYQAHHERWARRGVLAALETLFIAAGPAILALSDGERRMSNYLQLGEWLAETEPETYGMDGLIHRLERAIAGADEDAATEDTQLRLESDDALVRIATVHVSKGLEYPIVFLPFALYLGAPTGRADPSKPPFVYHDPESATPEQARIDLVGRSESARTRAAQEFHGEALRLLYVALTRAADALFVSWREPGDGASRRSAGNGSRHTAFHQLLGRDEASVAARFAELAKAHPATIVVETVDSDAPPADIPAVAIAEAAPLVATARQLPAPRTPWSNWSFSRLAHGPANTGAPLPGAEDEWAVPVPHGADPTAAASDATDDTPLPVLDRTLAGVDFGSAVHDLLENGVFNGWPAPGASLTGDARKHTEDRLRRYGLLGERGGAARVEQTAALVARTLHTPLPTIGPLADIGRQRLRAEMGFLLGMGDQRLGRVIEAARAAGYLAAPLSRSGHRSLNGLLQGFIDLVVEADGAYWILDYKTNRLGDTAGDYRPAALRAAITSAHYDLQYLLYTVALHRHLRHCFADTYDPATHLGGVQYLFVRAMDSVSQRGVFVDRPDMALIEQLDALFDGQVLDT